MGTGIAPYRRLVSLRSWRRSAGGMLLLALTVALAGVLAGTRPAGAAGVTADAGAAATVVPPRPKTAGTDAAAYGAGLGRGGRAVAALAPLAPPLPLDPGALAGIVEQVVLAFLRGLATALRDALAAVLASPLNFVTQTPPAGSYASPAVAGLWGVVRGIANGALALVAVWGGVNLMVREHIAAPYHEAMELIPRLVLGALLVNTSLAWTRLLIDADNALCAAVGQASLPAWQQAGANLQAFADVVAGLLYLVTGLCLVLQMLMRLALVDVLLVVAPLALLCWTLPQTQGWARRWSAAFTGAVFTQFVQIVALKLGAELFTDLTPASGVGEAVLPSLLGIALLVLTIRLPGLLGTRGGGGGGGVLRYIVYQQLRGR